MYFLRTIDNDVIRVVLPNGVKEFKFKAHTDDRKRASREADRFEIEYIADLNQRLGREPTNNELLDGKIKAATDSRTFAEKYYDEKYQVAKNGELSQLEKMLEDADEELERERYRNLSPIEKRREDIARMVAREEVENDLKSSHTKRLAKHTKTIEQLKISQHQQNWSNNSDEKDRVLIAQALRILETENSDLRPLQPLLNQINERAEMRRQEKQAGLQQQSDVSAAQQVAISEQQSILAEGNDDVSNQ